MNYLTAIEKQNEQLREIAWFQSHIVRAPLAHILGLVDLLVNDIEKPPFTEALALIKISAEELDNVVVKLSMNLI